MDDLLLVRDGELFHLQGEKETPFESPFAQAREAEDQRTFENNRWRAGSGGMEENTQSMIPRGMLWGGKGQLAPPQRPKIGYAFHAGERWYYTLTMPRAAGLFYWDRTRNEEVRLFHKQGFTSEPFCVLPDRRIIITARHEDGSGNLVLLDENGVEREQLTEGDSVDSNPFFHDGWIYFDSTGLGRNAEGIVMAHAPTTIQRMRLDSGEVETVLEDEKFDLLSPKITESGTLYVLRIPKQSQARYGTGAALKDAVLFPFRLLMGLFGFLALFSQFFGNQKLTSSQGPRVERDLSQARIQQRFVDIEKESKKAGEKVAAPESWELIRVRNSNIESVARRVCAFEIAGDKVLYSRGYDLREPEGGVRKTSGELITALSGYSQRLVSVS
ncbi:MAG: hypothetical protein QM758_12865 [Armatimonas sp.]